MNTTTSISAPADIADAASPTILNILLSFEELALVLKLLNVGMLPGVQRPFSATLTPQQEAQAFQVAARSLRARELARITADSQLGLHAALLAAVKVCAGADRAIILHRFGPAGGVAEAYGALLGDAAVAYREPEPGLIRLTVLADTGALVAHLLRIGGCASVSAGAGAPATIDDGALAEARELAKAGRVDAAAAVLNEGGASAAHAIAATLGEPHGVTVLHYVAAQPGGAITRLERSVLHGPLGAWLMTPSAPGTHRVEPIDAAALGTRIGDLVAAPDWAAAA